MWVCFSRSEPISYAKPWFSPVSRTWYSTRCLWLNEWIPIFPILPSIPFFPNFIISYNVYYSEDMKDKIYMCIKSSHWTPYTYTVLHVKYTSKSWKKWIYKSRKIATDTQPQFDSPPPTPNPTLKQGFLMQVIVWKGDTKTTGGKVGKWKKEGEHPIKVNYQARLT